MYCSFIFNQNINEISSFIIKINTKKQVQGSQVSQLLQLLGISGIISNQKQNLALCQEIDWVSKVICQAMFQELDKLHI